MTISVYAALTHIHTSPCTILVCCSIDLTVHSGIDDLVGRNESFFSYVGWLLLRCLRTPTSFCSWHSAATAAIKDATAAFLSGL